MSYKMSSALFETQATKEVFSQLHLDTMPDYGISVKIKFLISSLKSGALREFKRKLKTAATQSVKGAKAAEETDSNHILSISLFKSPQTVRTTRRNRESKKLLRENG